MHAQGDARVSSQSMFTQSKSATRISGTLCPNRNNSFPSLRATSTLKSGQTGPRSKVCSSQCGSPGCRTCREGSVIVRWLGKFLCLWRDASGSALIEYSLIITIAIALIGVGLGSAGVWAAGMWVRLLSALSP